MPTTTYAHVDLRDGVPYLEGSGTKVVEVVLDYLAGKHDASEIHDQHPYLSMAQIHSALAYYFDHQSEIDADIERRSAIADDLHGRTGPQFTRAELEVRLQKGVRSSSDPS